MARMEKRRVADRFFKLYTQNMGGTQIWVDLETKVQYLWHAEGYAGGLTVLLDADGKPLLYRETPNAPEY